MTDQSEETPTPTLETETEYSLLDFHKDYQSHPRYRVGDRVFFDGVEDIGRVKGRAYDLDEQIVYWVEFKDGTKDVYSAHQLKPIPRESNADSRSRQDPAERNSGEKPGGSSEGL